MASFTSLKTTQLEFIETHLRGTGRTLTAAQARATYGIKNLRAVMSTARMQGLRVRTAQNSVGNTTYAVSRRTVAGYQGKLLA